MRKNIIILVILVIIFMNFSCTEEVLVPYEVIVTDTVSINTIEYPFVDPEILAINDSLVSKWNTFQYNVTRMVDTQVNGRETYGYNYPELCAVLDTLLPDKNIVKSYDVQYSKDYDKTHELMVIKKYRCDDVIDTVQWEIKLSANYMNNLVGNRKSFIITEKKDNVVLLVYQVLFFNLGNKPTEFTPTNALNIERVFNFNDPNPYSIVQFNMWFGKE